MISQSIYLFPDTNSAEISEVGGKGYSLILGSQAGLPVPPGFILSVSFFTPWWEELQKTKTWSEFLKAKPEELENICKLLKQQATQLNFTKDQEQAISNVLANYDQKSVFAVRSSSPEEDLEGSSFAGGYETVLGVPKSELNKAIKKAFASCLDYRVAVYKLANRFDTKNPKIAVIIQEQIASEIAGVGFSFNPVTNNYDEAVFNANWGLGETVVAGTTTTTPDTYTVNKIDLKIVKKQLGKKEQAIYLTSGGGTKQKEDIVHDTFTLSDKQVGELTTLIKQVEELYQKPIDIEWAYEKEKLFLLQARPITTYIPLPKSMLTDPSEKKRLYLDATISIQGLYQPLSVTGTSFFAVAMGVITKTVFMRDLTKNINEALPWIAPGRLYLNLSNLLNLVGKKKFANFATIMDPLAAKTIETINENEYSSSQNKMLLLPFGIVLKLPYILNKIRRARTNPDQTHQITQQQMQKFREKAQQLVHEDIPLTLLTKKLMQTLINDVFLHTVPLFIIGKRAMGGE